MTTQERVLMKELISQAIQERGPLPLTVLPNNVLPSTVLPKAVYSPVKKCLRDNFPEFYVFGTSGHETVDHADSALSRFYRLLMEQTDYQSTGTPITLSLVAELAQQAGLQSKCSVTAEDAQKLLKPYPAYQLDNAPAPVVVVTANPALQFLQSVAFWDWAKLFKKLSQHSATAIDSMDQMRQALTNRFTKALLTGEGLLLHGMDTDAPRVVLSTGYHAANGQEFYCVLRPNTTENRRQSWTLAGAAYPNESDALGLGTWLAQTFFPQAAIDYTAIRQRIQDLEQQRHQLDGQLSAFLETLRDGKHPQVLSKDLRQYEQGWSSLQSQLEQIPGLTDPKALTLGQIRNLVDEKSAAKDLSGDAVALFDQVFHGIGTMQEFLPLTLPTEDHTRVHQLFTAGNIQADVEAFQEILHPYSCLKKILQTTSRDEVHDSIALVAQHFGLSKMDILRYVLGDYNEAYHFLDHLESIHGILQSCLEASNHQEAPVLPTMDAEQLFQWVFHQADSLDTRWICLYQALLPEAEALRAVILPENSTSLTPSAVAARVWAHCQNQDRLAEQYLLLGLLTDRDACAQQLLALYRQTQDADRFLTLWNSDYLKTECTTADVCYYLAIQCAAPQVSWEQIGQFVSRYPEVKQCQDYEEAVLAPLCRCGSQSVAFQRWLSGKAPQLNALEMALANNNPDAVEALLADHDTMETLGYDAPAREQIQRALTDGLTTGTSGYTKALRLHAAQGNKNSAAECMLWTAPLTPAVRTLLFDIYSANVDHTSLCWLMQKFPVPLDTLARLSAYGNALHTTGQHQALAELLTLHPELWHQSVLLEGLEESHWQAIYQREAAHPILPLDHFALALIRDDAPAMEALLADLPQMETWSYPQQLCLSLQEKLVAGNAPTGNDPVAVVKRFYHYIGNQNRHLEDYLHQQYDDHREWVLQHLYALAFAEGRDTDVCHYFLARPLLARNVNNITMYLWCLLRTGQMESLFLQAQQHPECLRADSALAQAVMEAARQADMADFCQSIQRLIDLLPQNPFEQAVITGDTAEIQKYISDPDLLKDLDYSAENIARFKDRFSKPMPLGNSGYPLAIRMHMYFGNDRALPFLLDAQEDPRAAKLLMDIYYSAQQWDDACDLYRAQPGDVWNATHRMRYWDALSHSYDPNNCRIYLKLLEDAKPPVARNAVDHWKCLRCLVGIGQEDAAMEQMQLLLDSDYECVTEVALDLFDMVWNTGSDQLRQHTALFAARLYLKHVDALTLEMQKGILSLHNNLIQEPDAQRWITLFQDNGLDSIATLLMCYFKYGIGDDTDSVHAAADALFTLLAESQGHCDENVLIAVTNFALSNQLLSDPTTEKYQLLLDCWLGHILSIRPESGLMGLVSLSDTEFTTFCHFWETVTPTQAQQEMVETACLQAAQAPSAKFFQRVAVMTGNASDPTIRQQLLDAFAQWFLSIRPEDTTALKVAAHFLENASLTQEQLGRFLQQTADSEVLYEGAIQKTIFAICGQDWPQLQYCYLQGLYFHSQQEAQQQEALHLAQQLLPQVWQLLPIDSDCLRFAYSIVCNAPSQAQLETLHHLYLRGEKPEQAQILLELAKVTDPSSDADALGIWFRGVLDTQDTEWIERYAKWWAPLIPLQETDNETKGIIPYLSDDDASMQYKASVLRLLLNNLQNHTYIGCYTRLERELSAPAQAKLSYLRAKYNPTGCGAAIALCVKHKQYLYAAKLLTTLVVPNASNGVFIGESAGSIFTAESLALCPELKDYVPAVFQHIIKLNQASSMGAWKNISRAVDIAILTQQEGLFLETFCRDYQDVYRTYTGKCAALIANIMLRQDFQAAQKYIEEYHQQKREDPYNYMALLTAILDDCLATGQLSPVNDILLRSIPVTGNMRPLEQYGALVHYAMKQNQLHACAQALYALRNHAPDDKALFASCIQLFQVVADTLDTQELYRVAKQYLSLVQDSLLNRTGKVMAIVCACADGNMNNLLEDCRSRILDSTVLSEIMTLKRECSNFLEGANGYGQKKRFLLRAATGWWTMDSETLQYFTADPELCAKLAELYPSAFTSACIAGALKHRDQNQLSSEIIAKLSNYEWAQNQINIALQYPDALCEKIIAMTDSPIDLPGVYAQQLQQAAAEPDEDNFTKLMTMLLVVQRNFTIKQYEENLYGLKETLEAYPVSRQNILSRLFLKKSTPVDSFLLPQKYLDTGDYETMILAAEKQLERIPALEATDANKATILTTLNTAYLELGQYMTDRSTTKKYTLKLLMDMATVLCQSKQYKDMDVLMEGWPAKWKLCLRSVQELIQGNPANVQQLLNHPSFRSHEGCCKFVYTMAIAYAKKKTWRDSLEWENSKRGRNWKPCYPDPSLETIRMYFILSSHRNYTRLSDFQAFLEKHIAEMEQDDLKAATTPATDDTHHESQRFLDPDSEADRSHSIWKLPFVEDCLAQLQPQDLPEAQPDAEATEQDAQQLSSQRDAQKAALQQALAASPNEAETIRLCTQLLALMRQEPVTGITKEICVTLALALYCEKREHVGLVVRANEESRNILYAVAPLLADVPQVHRFSGRLKVYIQQCLESYQNLSQFTADCMGSAFFQLCQIIGLEDRDAATVLKRRIKFAQDIGNKMRETMTNTERLRWLESCVANCRATTGHPIESVASKTLIDLLNQEIRAFRNKAQVHLTVYNHESVKGNPIIFGKVENLGSEPVSKLMISLSIAGVFQAQYTLASLAGAEMVPFHLPCNDDSNSEMLSYKLTLKYTTSDGTEETATPVESIMNLKDAQRLQTRFQYYDASNPADSHNYIERASISTTLEANYLVDGGFRRFPNFAIYGMKRSGKSSVLRRMGRLFEEHYPDQVDHVIVSCEGITGDFYTRAHRVFVQYVLDEVNYKFGLEDRDGWQEFCDKWAAVPEGQADFRWLDSFYAALNRQWLPDTGLIIMVDEIERLYFDLEEDFSTTTENKPMAVDASQMQSVLWDVMNKITQREGAMVRFVLCGSDFFTSKIIAEGDNLTQFFQKGVKLNVDRMEYAEIKAALCANTSITLHEDTIQYLWDIAAGLPWHSKIFCNSVIENQLIRQEGNTRAIIYPSDIQDAIDLTLSTTKDITSPANFGLLSLNLEEERIVHTLANVLDSRSATITLDSLMEAVLSEEKDAQKEELYAKALRSLVNERKLLKLDKNRNYQFGCELYRLYLRHELPSRFI